MEVNSIKGTKGNLKASITAWIMVFTMLTLNSTGFSAVALEEEPIVISASYNTHVMGGTGANAVRTGIQLGRTSRDEDRHAYLKFEYPSAPEKSYSKVILRLNRSAELNKDVFIHGLTGTHKTGWSESNLTWNMANTMGMVDVDNVIASSESLVKGWNEYDVTDYIRSQPDGIYAFKLTTTSTSGFGFTGRDDASFGPQLLFYPPESSFTTIPANENTHVMGGTGANAVRTGIQIGRTSRDEDRHAYLKFNYESVAVKTHGKVLLRLYRTSAGANIDLFVHGLTGTNKTDWSEATLTWNIANTMGMVDVDYVVASSQSLVKGWNEYDVTDYIKSQPDGTYAFKLTSTSTSGFGFTARDDAEFGPQLLFYPSDVQTEEDADAITIPDIVDGDFTLPLVGSKNNSKISWASDNTSVINIVYDNIAKVTSPPMGANGIDLFLIATVTQQDQITIKYFNIRVSEGSFGLPSIRINGNKRETSDPLINGEAVINMTVQNKGGDSQEVLVAALYERQGFKYKLVDIGMNKYNNPNQDQTYTYTADVNIKDGANSLVKVFLWEDISSMKAITPVWTFPSDLNESYEKTKPKQIVLTWQNSPQTTMTITWRTDSYLDDVKVLYSQDPHIAPEDYMVKGNGSSELLVADETALYYINSVELTGLSPGTEYYVIIPHANSEEKFKIRTISDNQDEIVFLAGSDLHVLSSSTSARNTRRAMHQQAALEDPDFVIVAGDLWYFEYQYEDNLENVTKGVDWFFDDWHELMITPDGRRIPMVPTEGNHDGNVYYASIADKTNPKANAPFYYGRLKLPGDGRYYSLNFNDDLTILSLNSDHSAAVEGEQTKWLEEQLKQYQDSTWLIAFHHIGPYPMYRDLMGTYESKVRRNWVPLYEEYGVNLVITGHDHLYKRTHPIKNGEVDEEGVVYIGDGGWAATRAPESGSKWYIYESAAVKETNYFRITKEEGSQTLQVVPRFPLTDKYTGTPFVLSALDTVERAKEALTFDMISSQPINNVTRSLNLIKTLKNTKITWESSQSDYIKTDGTVTTPTDGDKTVTLTAAIQKGSCVMTKDFVITVKAFDSNGLLFNVDNENRKVTITGNNTFKGGDKITLLVEDEEGNIRHIDQRKRGHIDNAPDGFFEFELTLPAPLASNKYIVKIGSNDQVSPCEAYFYIYTYETNVAVEKVASGNGLNRLLVG